MKKTRMLFAGAAFVLAISGAYVSNGQRVKISDANRPETTTLYNPVTCNAFSCSTTGTVSCNNYRTVPPSAPGLTNCSAPIINSLKHL
jgi:hypothetical protein